MEFIRGGEKNNMINFEDDIIDYITSEIDVLKHIDTSEVESAAATLYEAIHKQKTIYCFGNGGSASTASHFVNDFNKILNSKCEKKFSCICLNDNVPTIMAVANDIGYEDIFRFQLEGHINPGDIIIAISGSGNSKNIINAVEYAKKQNAIVIGLTGFNGGALGEMCDINLHAPIDNMQITEDIHLMFNHLIVSVLSKFL